MQTPYIKPRCPDCGRLYRGKTCSCRKVVKRWRGLRCDCGQPALEILVDRFGEWPLCMQHLAECTEIRFPVPAPVIKKPARSLVSYNVPLPRLQAARLRETGQNPYGLTERQMQVAALCHLRRRQIAAELGISEMTVKAHLHRMMIRMRLHRRREIQEKLGITPKS